MKLICNDVPDETFEINLGSTKEPTNIALKISKIYGKLRWFLCAPGHKQNGKVALVTFHSGTYHKHQPFDN